MILDQRAGNMVKLAACGVQRAGEQGPETEDQIL